MASTTDEKATAPTTTTTTTTTPVVPFRTAVQPKVYLVGDSMTETGFHWQNGWGLELTRRLLRRADVLNRGLGGYTTRSIRALLEASTTQTTSENGDDDDDDENNDNVVLSANGQIAIASDAFLPATPEKVAFCVLFLGTNDSNLPGHPSHVPLDEFRQNYEYIARNLWQRSQHGILCVLPPPEHGGNLLEWLAEFLPLMGLPPPPQDATAPPERVDRMREYGQAIREIATMLEQEQLECNNAEIAPGSDPKQNKQTKFCAVVDAFGAFTERFGDCGSREALCDGLHLGPAGHDLMTELVWDELVRRGLGVQTTEANAILAQKLWHCPSPTWFMDELGASSQGMPRSEPPYTAWW